jgi:site-specific DNA-cytosine methylase
VKPGEYLWRAFERLYGEEGATHENGHRKGRPGFLHYKLDPSKLCTTVTGGNHIYHHAEPRCLTVLEQQLLCGYPADYKFYGAPSNQYAQIAKAVLPPAGKWVATLVRKGLERGERIRKPGVELHNFIKPGDGRRFAEEW